MPLLLPLLLAAADRQQCVYDVRLQLLVSVPEGTKKLCVWYAMPMTEHYQVIENFRVLAPGPHRRVQDATGNRQVYFEAEAPHLETYAITQTFRLIRTEQLSGLHAEYTRALTAAEESGLACYLDPDNHLLVNDEMRRLARDIVGDEDNPTLAARRLYDWLLDHAEYWVKFPERYAPSGVGSADYCLDTGAGDSADLHTLWVSLARSAGIHSRIVYGAVLNPELNRMDIDAGARSWAEFYAPGYGWVPVDVATADLFSNAFPIHDRNGRGVRLATADGYNGPSPGKVDYYFGNLDARRLVLSRDRDLILRPPAASGLVNAMPKAHVEADGVPLKEGAFWSRKLTFRQRSSR